jgi:hypothetical protein
VDQLTSIGLGHRITACEVSCPGRENGTKRSTELLRERDGLVDRGSSSLGVHQLTLLHKADG